jgi:hypothetical protein
VAVSSFSNRQLNCKIQNRAANQPFLLFDRAAGFLPSRPHGETGDARSGGQGRPSR